MAEVARKADPGNVWLDVLVEGHRWFTPGQAKTTVSVYLAGNEPVDFFGDPARSFAPRTQERAAFERALRLVENVSNIDFVAVRDIERADIFLAHVGAEDADGALGFAFLPGDTVNAATGDEQSGIAINRDAYAGAGLSSLAQGGYDFVTYIHELGHALGLLHPHDPPDVFPGVSGPFGDFGAHAMNQGVYTMMSYNDGWPTGPNGAKMPAARPNFGWEGTPMALDVAALQHLYGANTSFHRGNDIYTLPGVNGAGTFYRCLWDAGGRDTLRNGSDLGAILDLRPATLLNAAGGGGFVSHASGIDGGYTIANDVVIENALGGGGADRIIGNGAGNLLIGGGGNDRMIGHGGNDLVIGGNGNDDLVGGQGGDRLLGGPGLDHLAGQVGADRFVFAKLDAGAAVDVIRDFGNGADRIALAAIDARLGRLNNSFSFIGRSDFSGEAGELRFATNAANDYTMVTGDVDGDRSADLRIRLDGLHALTAVDFIL